MRQFNVKEKNRHPLILFEGIDFSGKTSCLKKILIELKLKKSSTLIKNYSEPSLTSQIFQQGTLVDEVNPYDGLTTRIRDLFNTVSNQEYEGIYLKDSFMYHLCSMGRIKLYELMIPLLKNEIVFLDRSFPSTMVYQGKAHDREDMTLSSHILEDTKKMIVSIMVREGLIFTKYVPDLIIFFDIDLLHYKLRSEERKAIKIYDFDPDIIIAERITRYKTCMEILVESDFNVVTIDANKDFINMYHNVVDILSKFLEDNKFSNLNV